MDKIILKKMQFYGFHGLLPEERKLGQRFDVDVELFLDLQKPGKTDIMDDSVNYAIVYEKVKEIVEGEAKNLIEAVAELIAKELFTSFDLIKASVVRVYKPNPPIPGQYESVIVEIYRERTL